MWGSDEGQRALRVPDRGQPRSQACVRGIYELTDGSTEGGGILYLPQGLRRPFYVWLTCDAPLRYDGQPLL